MTAKINVRHFLHSINNTQSYFRYNVDLKSLLQQGISESLFYFNLVYKLQIIVEKPSFPYQLKNNQMLALGLSMSVCVLKKVSKGAKIRNRYNQVPGYQWESNKLTVINHKWKPRGQPFPSRWPQGRYKQMRKKGSFSLLHHNN